MSLRKQLVLIGALILLLPFAGLRFAVVLEESLRASQEASHLQLTRFIGEALSLHLQVLPDSSNALLLMPLRQNIILDGYQNDWAAIPWIVTDSSVKSTRIKLGIANNHLFLLLNLTDPSIVYQKPGAQSQLFDQLILSLQQQPPLSNATGQQQELPASYAADTAFIQTFKVYSDGPGPVQLLPGSSRNLLGVWQANQQGSVVELEVTLPASGITSINLAWLDINQRETDLYTRNLHQLIGNEQQGQQLLYLDKATGKLATQLTPDNTLLRIFTAQRKILFEYDRYPEQDLVTTQHPWRGLLRRLLTQSIQSNTRQQLPQVTSRPTPYTTWQRPANTPSATLTSFYPVLTDRPAATSQDFRKEHATPPVKAWVSLEKQTTQVAALADNAIFQVLTRVTLVVLLIVVVLFGYASWLSWRIRTLKRNIIAAMNPEQRFQNAFASSAINDELGELSRGFADMLGRLQNYAEYMETFASKLTHECRTPLAIVSSSLQLLASSENKQEQQEYLQRAQLGTSRISALLTAMRQATQLEASIQHQEKQNIDLAPIVKELSEAYRDLLPLHRVILAADGTTAIIEGNADLLAQAIDKLVENAKDFTPEQGTITLGLECRTGSIQLWVENQGSAVADDLINRVFEPFVSHREASDEALHLGLGLVVVKLIADFHHARIMVANRIDKTATENSEVPASSVRFTLIF